MEQILGEKHWTVALPIKNQKQTISSAETFSSCWGRQMSTGWIEGRLRPEFFSICVILINYWHLPPKVTTTSKTNFARNYIYWHNRDTKTRPDLVNLSSFMIFSSFQARSVHKDSLDNAQGRRNPRGAKLSPDAKFTNIKSALIKFCTVAPEGLRACIFFAAMALIL